MREANAHYPLTSDNTAGICPEALAALTKANHGDAPSYGDDFWTNAVRDQIRELFETDCAVFFVSNGTAANALALAQLCQSFHSIVCHQHAHLQTDECGAPEFFTGGSKLLLTGGENSKIDFAEAEMVIARQQPLHSHKPRALSVTQSTELGTTYSVEEIGALAELARHHNLALHMDGARFANAVASLGCKPKQLTWQVGVDVLCFGGTKNGLAGAELVLFFNKELAVDFEYRLKQAGQLQSKARFLAAQWHGVLTDDVWLRNARHANEMAQKLAARLQAEAEIAPVFPVQANAVFVRFGPQIQLGLQARGWHLYQFVEPDICRMMCSWSVTTSDLDRFISDLVCIQQSLS